MASPSRNSVTIETHEQKPASPALQDQVACARNQPTQRRCNNRHGGERCRFGWTRSALYFFQSGNSPSQMITISRWIFPVTSAPLGRTSISDFAAHAELGKINARLDGETGIWQDAALIVDLKIIHVRAVRMNFGGDRVPGAMDKILPVTLVLDVITDCAIDLPSGNRLALQ